MGYGLNTYAYKRKQKKSQMSNGKSNFNLEIVIYSNCVIFYLQTILIHCQKK